MRDLEVNLRDFKFAKYFKERAGLRADTEIIAINAIERAIKAEAEVERLQTLLETLNSECIVCDSVSEIAKVQAENAKLRKVVEAASELVTQINNRTKTMGLDMSNYHAISITVKPGDAGRDYWEAVWAFEQALAELDKEPSHE